MVHIGNQAIPLKVIKLLPEKLIRRRNVLPLAILAKSPHRPLLVATSAPSNLSLRDEVAFVARMRVIPALASDRDIEQAIARYFDVIARSDEMPWDATGAADLVDSPDTHVPLHTGRISTGYPFV